MTPNEAIAERIKEAMILRRMTQSAVCNAAGISKSLLTHILKGRRPPTEETLHYISEALDVSYTWLSSGLGERTSEPDQNTALAKFVYRVLHQEQGTFKARLIDRLIELSDEDWATLERIFEAKEGD